MEKLIPVINKLQDVFNAVGSEAIDLPQIVVVGSQSSGKSSVLENIVGRDFLPRGSGIVTRRPLVLQLINLPWEGGAQDSPIEEWGEFLHRSGETFHDFNKIRSEIVAETDRMTGTNKGVSPVPINLKIYSPHVLNLTLVDLPGITKIPVGDQPTDIEKQIRDMVLTYIRRPSAIIVAVTSANTDLANSDSLQLAKEVDPQGERTVGVLTKIDLMDKGTDALDVLMGTLLPLKLGFVGVVNRSQADIIANKPIREALKSETKYFAGHPVYRKIAHRCGTAHLATTLNRVLLEHIRKVLPDLKGKISAQLEQSEKELAAYGGPGALGEGVDEARNLGAQLLALLTRFSSDFAHAIEGKLMDQPGSGQQANASKELYGGARINYIFTEIFGKYLKGMSPTDGLTLDDIRTALRNATGPRTALFVPEIAFELLTKRQVTRLEEPALQCVDAVHEELMRIVSQLQGKELLRYAVLRERLAMVVTELLTECRRPCRDMIRDLVQIELAFINTAHPDFAGSVGAINNIVEKATEERVALRKVEWMSAYEGKRKEEDERARLAASVTSSSSAASNAARAASVAQRQPPLTASALTPTLGGGAGGASYNPFSAASVQQGQGHHQQQQQAGKSKRASQGVVHLDHVPLTIKAEGALSEREQMETDLIKSLLESYFVIVRKNVQDGVPKTIMHFLVTRAKQAVHNRLVEKLYKEDLFAELLSEAPEVAQRRKATRDMVDMLKRAREILNEVRDFTMK